jgi:hypothetical protein
MATDPPAGGPLTDVDLTELAALLARYAAHHLDQFEHWRVHTPFGPAFIEIGRKAQPDVPVSLYQTIWPPTEREADIRRDRWVVWRQDDNGNRFEVARRDSRSEAETLAAAMQARGLPATRLGTTATTNGTACMKGSLSGSGKHRAAPPASSWC